MIQTTPINCMAQEVFQAMNKRDFAAFEKIISEELAFDFPGAGKVDGSRRKMPAWCGRNREKT